MAKEFKQFKAFGKDKKVDDKDDSVRHLREVKDEEKVKDKDKKKKDKDGEKTASLASYFTPEA